MAITTQKQYLLHIYNIYTTYRDGLEIQIFTVTNNFVHIVLVNQTIYFSLEHSLVIKK